VGRGKIWLKHYSIRTEQAYLDWIKRFILHFDKVHPQHIYMENGYDIRTPKELHGHSDVSTTMIYPHILIKCGKGVKSPLDTF